MPRVRWKVSKQYGGGIPKRASRFLALLSQSHYPWGRLSQPDSVLLFRVAKPVFTLEVRAVDNGSEARPDNVSMASFTRQEFESLLADKSKRVEGDITWQNDEDHSPCVEFRKEIHSDMGYPLFVSGSYNHEAQTLSFTVIHRSVGRIYALDLGKNHRNPHDRSLLGDKHKHGWSEQYRDKEAYVPEDIDATIDDPAQVWAQFCMEACIVHNGKIVTPKPPKGLFDD